MPPLAAQSLGPFEPGCQLPPCLPSSLAVPAAPPHLHVAAVPLAGHEATSDETQDVK
jgi:hypothetical protein